MMENNKRFRFGCLTLAVQAVLWAQPGESLALNDCQLKQLEAAKDLIYKQSDLSGLIGCDIQAKKNNSTFDSTECKSLTFGPELPNTASNFKNAYCPTIKNRSGDVSCPGGTDDPNYKEPLNGCTFLFHYDSTFELWSGYISTFEDPECNDVNKSNNCKDDGRKRRRARKIDTLFAHEARWLLDQCKKAQPDFNWSKSFRNKRRNLLEARPDMFQANPDPMQDERAQHLLKATHDICMDIGSKSAIKVSVVDTVIPGLSDDLLNVERAHDGSKLKVDVNRDESNILNTVQELTASWSASGLQLGPFSKEVEGYFSISLTKDDIETFSGYKIDNELADNVNKTVNLGFIDPKSPQKKPLLNTQSIVSVDIVPPQSPKLESPQMGFPVSVTVSREHKILKQVLEKGGNYTVEDFSPPADDLLLPVSVTNFRGPDAQHNNTAEADALEIKLRNKADSAPSDLITAYEPALPVRDWVPDQKVTVKISATQIVNSTQSARGAITLTAALLDAAGNRSDTDMTSSPSINPDRVTKKDIEVINQPPAPVDILPVTESCGEGPMQRQVFNLKANAADKSNDPRWIDIQLPDNLLTGDKLALRFRKATETDDQAVDAILLPVPLSEKDRGTAIYSRLVFNPAPNESGDGPLKEDYPENGVLLAYIQNGGVTGDAIRKSVFVDLVAPDQPQFPNPPNYEANKEYKFTVKTGSPADTLKVTRPDAEDSALTVDVPCNQGTTDATLWDCSFTSSDINPPTITASVEDWACNPGATAHFTPPQKIPRPSIQVPTTSCNNRGNLRTVYNANNNKEGITVSVGPNLVLQNDKLILSLTKPKEDLRFTNLVVGEENKVSYKLPDIDLSSAPHTKNGTFKSWVARDQNLGDTVSSNFYVDTVRPVFVNIFSVKPVFNDSDHCEYEITRLVTSDDDLYYPGICDITAGTAGQQDLKLSCLVPPRGDLTLSLQDWACNEVTHKEHCNKTPSEGGL